LEKITVGGYELIDGFERVTGEKTVYDFVYRAFSWKIKKQRFITKCCNT
jgi:hypothetical protein